VKDTKDPSGYKPWQDNPNDIVQLDSTTGKTLGQSDSLAYADDNSAVVSTDNMADSRAKNRTRIANLQSADASENNPQSFSGDPVIEAGLRTNAAQQAKLERVRASSVPSGNMNKATDEAPLIEYDVEQ